MIYIQISGNQRAADSGPVQDGSDEKSAFGDDGSGDSSSEPWRYLPDAD